MLAELRITSADAARIPSVGGNLNLATNQTAVSSNTSSQTRDSGFFYNIGVTQPLFHWRALQNQSASARLNRLVADKSYDRAARDVALLVRKAYLALVVEKARLRAARDALRVLREDLAVTTEKRERGLIAAAALEGDRLREREVRLEVARLESDFEANRRRFARLVGLPGALEEGDVPDDIPVPRFSAEIAGILAATVLRDNARSTLEFEIAELRIRDAQLRINSEKVRLFPKFFASAGLSLENSTNVNGNTVSQQGIQRRNVSVYAQWNIFDGFATRAAIREAQASKRVQERLQQAEIEGLMQNIQILERMLRDDAEQVELTGIRHGLAIEARKAAARESDLGNVPKSELSRAGTAILQTEARSLEARAQFLGRWGEFVSLTVGESLLNKSPSSHASETK
jgi:outer membrane protein TolC